MNGGWQGCQLMASMRHTRIYIPGIWRLGMIPWVRLVFGLQQREAYLICPIFFASCNHWVWSSILSPVMLLGSFSLLSYREGRKVWRIEITICSLGKRQPVQNRMIKATKGVGQREVKGATQDFFFLEVGYIQLSWNDLWWMLVQTWLVWLKPIQKDYESMPLRIWQIIGQEVLNSCWRAILWYPWTGR